MIRAIFNLIFTLRNAAQRTFKKGLDQVRDPYTGKITFMSPDNLKTSMKVIFFLLFASVLAYVMLK